MHAKAPTFFRKAVIGTLKDRGGWFHLKIIGDPYAFFAGSFWILFFFSFFFFENFFFQMRNLRRNTGFASQSEQVPDDAPPASSMLVLPTTSCS